MATKTFNPRKLTFVFAGISVETFADDDFVTIERDADAFTDTVGAAGDVTREQTNDERATITLRIPRTAPENGALQAVHTADTLTGGGAGIGPLTIKDELGADLHTAKEAWISRAPDPKYSKQTAMNEWKFRAANLISASLGS